MVDEARASLASGSLSFRSLLFSASGSRFFFCPSSYAALYRQTSPESVSIAGGAVAGCFSGLPHLPVRSTSPVTGSGFPIRCLWDRDPTPDTWQLALS